ncbi:MAG: Tungsten formylmethanofuran dehydrogenase, subunit D [Methanothrix harundinacea]|uniref:Tungsten formylmethanofuran dehydrogenase, subunit D n=1 Tax=Methanothrix harundinacea TaxID=301375 RepID=A0A117LG46_9EURY|nr:MAG: Tungsten formylmethanofuran dehydrogenase, subunit D [Methanothrix harundinacea]KUK96910.1 MAG: Tungsten formylmethanofuran dehydrogenase, subunit D [Methanothrix harundinacea]
MKAMMISGRTLGQGATSEAKMSTEFFRATSFCALSELDYNALGVSEGGNVLVRTKFGEVVVSAKKDKGLPSGVIFIPMGPWANALVGPETGGCGTPQFKGVEAEVEETKMVVLDVRELFADLKAGAETS